jgi:hypothetical protein
MKTLVFLLSAPVAVLLILFLPYQALTHSKGAPIGSTGGPNQTDSCSASGCHDTGTDNTGGGTITITTPASFSPGDTVSFTVRVEQNGARRFGFQATVRRADNKRPVGAVQLANGTQFSDAIGDYITHDDAADKDDAAEWTFQWKAPDQDVGNIVVYAAGVAANGNGNRFGDNVYTSNATMPTRVSVEGEQPSNRFFLEPAFPNPFMEQTTVRYSLSHPEPVAFALYDALGRLVKAGDEEYMPAGTHEILIDAGDLPAGVYFYEVRTATVSEGRSIVKGR